VNKKVRTYLHFDDLHRRNLYLNNEGVYRVQLQIVRKELNPEMPGGRAMLALIWFRTCVALLLE
jgi:hypothetical protein